MTSIHVLFCLKYLVVALSIFGSAHALGHLASLALKSAPRLQCPHGLTSVISDPLLRSFYQMILGMAIWSYLVFFLGITHLLYSAPLWIVYIGSLVLEVVLIYRSVKTLKLARQTRSDTSKTSTSNQNNDKTTNQDATADAATTEPANKSTIFSSQANDHRPIRWADIPFVILLLAYAYTLFIPSLEPPHIWDDTCYHLPFAKLYADSHSLPVGTLLRFPLWNHFAEMLFTAAYMLLDTRATQLVAWSSGILTVVGIYAFLREKFGPYTGLIGAVTMCSARALSETFFTAYVETTLCLYIAGFVIALARISSNNRRLMLVLAGTCAGCAIATKYTACLVVGLTLGVWLLAELIGRAFRLRDLIYLFTPLMIVSGPWFIRNLICSGNPVFPFLPKVFGLGGLWNEYDLQWQWAMWKSRCVVPINQENIVKLPWMLSFECPKFKDYTFCRLWHYSFLFGLLAIAIKKERLLIVFLIVAEVFLVWWFVTCQSVRYSIPVLPIVALIGGWASHTIWTTFSRLSFAKPLAAVALVLIVGLGITKSTFRNQTWLVYATAEEQQRFLKIILPTYTAYEFLNRQEKGNLYALWDDRMNFYYTNGTFIGSDFGPGRFKDFMTSLRSREDLLAYLGQFKTKYLLVYKKAPAFWTRDPAYPKIDEIRHMEGFRVIFEDKEAVVYQITY